MKTPNELTQLADEQNPPETSRQLVPINAQSVLKLPGKITKVSWQIPRSITLEEWIESMRVLSSIEGALQWWLGDGWAGGEDREWGEGEEVADKIGVNYSTITTYASVCRKFKFSSRLENLSFSHHQEVALAASIKTDRERQKWLNRALKGTNGVPWSVAKLRSAIAQAKAIEGTQQVAFDADRLGKHVIILADPPWRYENPPLGGSNRSIESHYPTLTLEDICALPVADIAHENAILFLWATAPKLAECMQVVAAWGFEYRTNMIWDKEIIGMGYHFRNQHELLLVGKRGELAPPAPENRPASIIRARRSDEHSAKPEIIYDLIERMYPEVGAGQKIELFARNKRRGWDTWGNSNRVAILEAAE